jgi:hypothetical protein
MFAFRRNIRPSGTHPLAATRYASLPPNEQVPSGRIFLSQPQHITDIIILARCQLFCMIADTQLD